jgi:hypothetical protein
MEHVKIKYLDYVKKLIKFKLILFKKFFKKFFNIIIYK